MFDKIRNLLASFEYGFYSEERLAKELDDLFRFWVKVECMRQNLETQYTWELDS